MDIHTDTFGGEYPFKGNYVEVNGVRLHYVDEYPEGNPKAEPVVMLHGNPTWSFLYRKFIPPLVKAGYRAIAVDHIDWGAKDELLPNMRMFELWKQYYPQAETALVP